MHAILKKLLGSELFSFSNLELGVMPRLKSACISGYVDLKHQDHTHDDMKNRFEGEEARLVKNALKNVLKEEKNTFVEVKTTPTFKGTKLVGYEFSITKNYETSEEKQAEIRLMKNAGWIDEYMYPIRLEKNHHHNA